NVTAGSGSPLEEQVEIEIPILHIQCKPSLESGDRVLLDADAVVGIDLSVLVDVLENQVAGTGTRPMRIRIQFVIVVKDTDDIVEHARIPRPTCLLLPFENRGRFIREDHFVFRISAVHADLKIQIAGLPPIGDEKIKSAVAKFADVLKRWIKAHGPRNGYVTCDQHLGTDIVEVVKFKVDLSSQYRTLDTDVAVVRHLPGDIRIGNWIQRLCDGRGEHIVVEDVAVSEAEVVGELELINPRIRR